MRQRLLHLARTTYVHVNFQHLTERLVEHERLTLSRPTVHRILTAAGVVSPRTRRPPRHRTRRDRMPQEGMLAQVDGSHHLWLEARPCARAPREHRRRYQQDPRRLLR